MGLVLDDDKVAAMMKKKMAVRVKVRVATSVAVAAPVVAVPMKMRVRVRVAALVAVAGRLPGSESPAGELEPLSREVWCTLGTKAPVRKPCYGLT